MTVSAVLMPPPQNKLAPSFLLRNKLRQHLFDLYPILFMHKQQCIFSDNLLGLVAQNPFDGRIAVGQSCSSINSPYPLGGGLDNRTKLLFAFPQHFFDPLTLDHLATTSSSRSRCSPQTSKPRARRRGAEPDYPHTPPT